MDSKFMKEAIKEAYDGINKKHGGPFGAVIVKDGKVIGKGHNRVLKDKDPTCHGEIMAIKDACKNLKSFDLSGSVLYTTAEPCPMCKGAILWANISKVYYGFNIEDTDKIWFRDQKFYDDWENDKEYLEEFDREECKKLFSDYLKDEHELY